MLMTVNQEMGSQPAKDETLGLVSVLLQFGLLKSIGLVCLFIFFKKSWALFHQKILKSGKICCFHLGLETKGIRLLFSFQAHFDFNYQKVPLIPLILSYYIYDADTQMMPWPRIFKCFPSSNHSLS